VRCFQYETTEPQLPELRRRDFFRFVTMPVLRIEGRHDRMPFVLRDDVHRQQTLPALRCTRINSRSRTTPDLEMSALQD
jgi:hypothetical protein